MPEINEIVRELAVEVEVMVKIWADGDVTEEQMTDFIEREEVKIKQAVGRFLEKEGEEDAGWIDDDHEAIVFESTDACVTKIKDLR